YVSPAGATARAFPGGRPAWGVIAAARSRGERCDGVGVRRNVAPAADPSAGGARVRDRRVALTGSRPIWRRQDGYGTIAAARNGYNDTRSRGPKSPFPRVLMR